MNAYQSKFDLDLLQEDAFYEVMEERRLQEQFEEEREEILFWAKHLAESRVPSKTAIQKIREHLNQIAAMI